MRTSERTPSQMAFVNSDQIMQRPTNAHSVVSFFSGSLAATALSMLATLLMMRWIPPEKFGLWNFALLVSTYISVFQIGVFNGLNRQIPYYEGRSDPERAARMANAAHGWCLVLAASSVVVTIVSGIGFILAEKPTDQVYTLFAIGSVVSCSWLLQFYTVVYSGSSHFGRLAKKNAVTAAVGLPLALLSLVVGYMGLLVRAAAMAAMNIVLLGNRRPVFSRPSWDLPALKELAAVGFPIWLLGQLGLLFMTLDRLVLAGSVKNLGLYSLAAQFAALAAMVSTSFNAVYYPQMARDYGSHHRALPLWWQAVGVAARSLACGVVLSAICWFLIPVFVNLVVPAYSAGIPAAQWAILIGVAMAPSIFGNIFNLLGRQGVFVISSALGLAAFASCWWILFRVLDNPPLTSAAQSMLVGTLVSSLTSSALAFAVCKRHDSAFAQVPQKRASTLP